MGLTSPLAALHVEHQDYGISNPSFPSLTLSGSTSLHAYGYEQIFSNPRGELPYIASHVTTVEMKPLKEGKTYLKDGRKRA